ncbi:hypothetical protein D0B54_18450 [Solimonas sp. K1W22B-7]|uniref:hypothetical protein n=1 Tax=Solimonas sp. K1W22B-7 TaxID=2303331 RepID=UPI000E335B60|nr:hypothetical protein [Solimonas sp. K1W22B-7]AXQ30541.1 hypothetical protein D0B54_18450 [Solimonas sp. K1W22B-7]
MKSYDSGLTTEVIARLQGDAWLDQMLDNWGRWARGGEIGGPQVYTACASAERHYSAPPWDSEDAGDQDRPDPLAGESVDIAWRRLPQLQRQVLRGVYVDPPRWRLRVEQGRDLSAGDADRHRARELRLPLALMLETYAAARVRISGLLRDGVMR